MGKLESEIQFTGPVGNLSAYRMRGVDKIIIRKKGGASRKRVQNSPEFAKTRLHNNKFSGRARGVHWVALALKPLKALSDHPFAGPLNKRIKYVQYRDEVSPVGLRTIAFSKHGSLLEGFSLNKENGLETLIKSPFRLSISRETLSAKIKIPALIPGKNFSPSNKHRFFSVMAVLAAVPDLYPMDTGFERYAPSHPGFNRAPAETSTEWFLADKGSPATTLEVKLKSPLPADDYALVLSIGLCFGEPAPGGAVEGIPHAGRAKIVAVAERNPIITNG